MRKLFAVVVLLLSVSQAKADGILTFQSGSYTAVANPPGGDVQVFGIDDAGQLLVSTQNGPYLFSGGSYDLVNAFGAPTVLVFALSENGTILGRYISGGTATYFTEAGGVAHNLPSVGFLNNLNDHGQFIGTTFDGSGQFVYNSNTGSLSPTANGAIAINDLGQVLGYFQSSGYILSPDGSIISLNLPAGCRPQAFNDSDQVAGNCFTNGKIQFNGFPYNNGTFTTINFNSSNTIISGINDSGEIVGFATNVPEPGTLFLCAFGFLIPIVRVRTAGLACNKFS